MDSTAAVSAHHGSSMLHRVGKAYQVSEDYCNLPMLLYHLASSLKKAFIDPKRKSFSSMASEIKNVTFLPLAPARLLLSLVRPVTERW